MYAQLLYDKTQKDFWVFYLFLEVIFVTLVLKVFLKMSNSLCWKIFCLAISFLPSWVVLSREILKKFQFLKNFRQRVSRVPYKWFVTQTWPTKTCPMHLHILWVGLWLVLKSLTRELPKKTVLKGSKIQFFKNSCLFALSDSHPQKTQLFFKTQPLLLEFWFLD